MKFGVCITTRNRVKELGDCLKALSSLSIKPSIIIVSDDSIEASMQEENRQVALKYGADYLIGPRKGVCANRNNALRQCLKSDPEYISFVDDDICLSQDFFENASNYYLSLRPAEHSHTILTGITQTQDGEKIGASKLTFRGYFTRSIIPQVVNIHAAVFPVSLFEHEIWDAELCLRASSRGFQITYRDDLIALHTCFQMGTLAELAVGKSSQYDVSVEAARLYVGIKRYKLIFPSPVRLILFIVIYFVHMIVYLARKGQIKLLGNILSMSNVQSLFREAV
jgi:glycosyltransferase involved in cell wall biosynthesis